MLPCLMVLALCGCANHSGEPLSAMTHGTAVVAIDLSVPTHPQVLADGIEISSARNAWTQWALQLDCAQFPARPVLRLPALGQGVSLAVYQVLPAPVDLNDAQYIRQSGDRGDTPSVPRALLPLTINGMDVDLTNIRDPAHPLNPGGHPVRGPVLIWVDAYIPAQTSPLNYRGMCQLLDARGGESAGAVPVQLNVKTITLAVEPHLHFSVDLDWQTLATLSPDLFGSIPPRLLRRGEERDAAIVRLLDAYVELAHENKTDLSIPRLQPIVKWPLGKMPEVDWNDFDSVVTPWLTGRAFKDQNPAGFWPLPAPDSLAEFDLATQCQYWQVAAEHFDQRMWLERSPVVVEKETDGPDGGVNDADAILMSAQARHILASYPRLGALLPLQDDQVQLADASNPAGIGLGSTGRLFALAPGLVSASPIRDWPDTALPPRHWIDASANLTPLASESGVRTLAWLAFSRDASLVRFGQALPEMAVSDQPARASQLPLFYPGQWYGTDAPLQTLSLKWIRQAEQDYEYLYEANQHGDRAVALKMCQLITRPVQLQPAQPMEGVFDLLAGSDDSIACQQASGLLLEQLTEPPGATDAVEPRTLRWFSDRQRPTLVGSSVKWMWNLSPDSSGSSLNSPAEADNYILAVVSADLYNPADNTQLGSQLLWNFTSPAWETNSDPVDVPPLGRYQVRPLTATARFNLNNVSSAGNEPLELRFTDSDSGVSVPCQLMLPVAVSPRRERAVKLDGSLDEWFAADALLLDRPLVKMLDRPSLHMAQLQLADQPTSLFSGWSNESFYLAFRLGGVTTADLRSTRNFVEYDHGRAWGEDLCEVLIQPIFIDNSAGPILHIVAKPGGEWVEQQRQPNGAWQPFEASGVRYASTVDASQQIWRGELAIPWRAIESPNHGRPALLRFNFIQHQNGTGQGASWAGPIDQSRDGKIAGLLLLKEP